jgi:OOP family OmpA-OmpF porin
MRSGVSSFVAAAVLAAACAPAGAEERGLYVGGALGQSKFREWCDTSGAPAGFSLVSCEDKDSTWKVLGGYRVNRHLAIEATYIDWGTVSGQVQFMGPRDVSAEQQSMGLAAVGAVPITRQFSIFGKLGLLLTDQQTRSATATSSATTDRDEREWHYGIGVKYALTRHWAVRAEWENTEALEVRMLSVGVEYSFAPALILDSVSYAGFYVGGSVGQMEAGADCPSGFSCDLKDTGWKIFGGYQAHRNLAVEVTYGNWGEITLSTQAAGVPVTGTGRISSWGAAALGLLPVRTPVSLFGKAGVLVTEQKVEAQGGGISTAQVSDGAEFHWGLGVIVDIARNFGLRAEWERLHKSELDFLSLGLQYRF